MLDCGDLTLPELRAVLDDAAIYIGGDSGPLHVAATSRVPIVGRERGRSRERRCASKNHEQQKDGQPAKTT